MENTVFNITERIESGKKVRLKGEVPGIIYGHSLDNAIPCKITKRELINLLASKKSVLSLKLNEKIENCVLKEVQRDPFGDIIHLDFQYVKEGDSVKLRVPIKFVGIESLDTRKLLLDDVIAEVQLQGNPDEMPEHIEVDVAKLEYGAQILGKDLAIPQNLKADVAADDIVARIGSLISVDVDDEQTAEEVVE